MDGTATGILVALTQFERPKIHVDRRQNIAKQQYMFSNQYDRKFIYHFFKQGGLRQTAAMFEVNLSTPSVCKIFLAKTTPKLMEEERSFLFLSL